MAIKNNKTAKILPTNKESLRKNCAMTLDMARERMEKLSELIEKTEELVTERFNNPDMMKFVTTYDLVLMYGKLVDAWAKIGKLSVETQQVMSGTFDESDELVTTKESAEQKKVRQVSEKMLALMAKAQYEKSKASNQ